MGTGLERVMNLSAREQRHRLWEHEHGEDEEVDAAQHIGQKLVVARQAPESGQPAEAALDHPAPGQQHEALFRLGQPDHLELNGVRLGCLSGFFSRVALVVPSQLHALARGPLHRLAARLQGASHPISPHPAGPYARGPRGSLSASPAPSPRSSLPPASGASAGRPPPTAESRWAAPSPGRARTGDPA